jgi:hypothetical protein
MTTNQTRETATIYQFPVGGRAGLAGRRKAADQAAAPVNAIALGSSWYHEEAIRDAELPRKN